MEKNGITISSRFFNCLLVVLAVLVSACSTTPSPYEVTHLPFKADEDSRWGLIDWEGNPLIEDEFTEKPSPVTEGCFYVKNSDGLYEFYTAEKRFKKIGKEYIRVGAFHDGLAPVVEKDQPVSFIRPDGTVAFTFSSYKDETVQAVSIFQEGKALFLTSTGKYGYIDVNGKVVVEPIYDYVSLYYNNTARVYKAQNEEYGETFIIDKNGKTYFKVNPDYEIVSLLSEDKFVYLEDIDGKTVSGFLDKKGQISLRASKKHEILLPLYRGFSVFINHPDKCGLMNKDGDIIIRAKYSGLISTKDVLIYTDKGKMGLISYSGDKICDAIYKDIIPFQGNNKYTYALDNNEWILIDKEGKDVHKGSFTEISIEIDNNNDLISTALIQDPSITLGLYGKIIESDYVNIQSEVNNSMKFINDDGSIDKLTYNTLPGDFAQIYNKDYKVDDLQDKQSMFELLKDERFIKSTVSVYYNSNVIIPNYERKLKSSYWGDTYWENEISGNNNAKIETFTLFLEPKNKLSDRKKEIFDAVCHWMETNGYTKLSTKKENENLSTYWEKKTPFTIQAGTHLKDGYISIAIGKKS